MRRRSPYPDAGQNFVALLGQLPHHALPCVAGRAGDKNLHSSLHLTICQHTADHCRAFVPRHPHRGSSGHCRSQHGDGVDEGRQRCCCGHVDQDIAPSSAGSLGILGTQLSTRALDVADTAAILFV
jgi:hypothetical protein